MRSHWTHCPLMLALVIGAGHGAHAGRPLTSDDASTTEKGTCQVETWVEGAGGNRAYVLSPACGTTEGLEVSGDVLLTEPSHDAGTSVGLALKWAPAARGVYTGLGKLRFGTKLGLGHEHPFGRGWRLTGVSVLGLASLRIAPSVTAHFNLGLQRERKASQTSTLINAAVEWIPWQAVLLFAEVQANDQGIHAGGAVRTVGARWWLASDVLGLDLTTSREAGSDDPMLWSIGLGWYGL